MSKIGLTVVICTYNGAKRLPSVIDCLRNQINTDKIPWEIIVVDNNSTDDTARLVRDYQSNWQETYPLKYCFEPKQGLAFARRKAIEEARGIFLGFLDDDNLPAPNWVEAVDQFLKLHPNVGAYGGQIHGEFEIEPPQGFERIARFLPILERADAICYNSYQYSRKNVLPPGAGIVIRKQAWLECIPSRPLLKGVSGQSLLAKGEDIETLSYLKRAGWEIWHNPEMHITHLIPKSRFEKDYLIRFFRGCGFSRYSTRIISYKAWQRPIVIPVYIVNDLKKIIVHFLKYRKTIQTDIVAACEMEFLLCSFVSPFYFWNRKLSVVRHLLLSGLIQRFKKSFRANSREARSFLR